MAQILVLDGPNLNLLGKRDPRLYGRETLAEIQNKLRSLASELGHQLDFLQSNHEGVLIDRLQETLNDGTEAVLLNAAAFTHTSVALRDTLEVLVPSIPVIEVHLSIPEGREDFRQRSLLAPVVSGRIEGFGSLSYLLALRAASGLIGARGNA